MMRKCRVLHELKTTRVIISVDVVMRAAGFQEQSAGDVGADVQQYWQRFGAVESRSPTSAGAAAAAASRRQKRQLNATDQVDVAREEVVGRC